ncbi:MAG: RidA family protein [SAR202 cluster bacterium]|nr:RidA family protein [SAR202 cluster bacterium]
MEIQRVNPEGLATPLAAYSQVVRAGSLVTTAGLIALDAEGKVVGEGDVEAQVRKTLDNLVIALESVGASLDDVIKTTLYVSDMADYKAVNDVYNGYFADIRPARATVEAPLVMPSLLFEMDAIAVVSD